MPGLYLFVDGGYLRATHARVMRDVFSASPSIDAEMIRRTHVTPHQPVERVFYYDCLEDQPRDGETLEFFQQRVKEQEEWYRQVRMLNGFFVRLGTLTGKKKNMRQKEVDVMLATDMLEHAYRKNMDRAILVAGDRDFVPLVEALVRLGTIITVSYHPSSTSSALYEAADEARSFSVDQVWNWCGGSFRAANPLPLYNTIIGEPNLHPRTIIKRGFCDGHPAKFWSEHARTFTAHILEPTFTREMHHPNLEILERYIHEKFGPLEFNAMATGQKP